MSTILRIVDLVIDKAEDFVGEPEGKELKEIKEYSFKGIRIFAKLSALIPGFPMGLIPLYAFWSTYASASVPLPL